MEGWLPVFTAIIAASATLAGVFLSNILTRRERELERTIVARRDAAEALLRRGEDLFLFVDRFDGYVARHVGLIEEYCHGHIDQDLYVTRRNELLVAREALELGRIQLSVQAFFPQVASLHEEATANLRHLATLDSVAGAGTELSPTTMYKLSADAVLLRKITQKNGQAMRHVLVQAVRDSFAEAGAKGFQAKPLDPSGAAR